MEILTVSWIIILVLIALMVFRGQTKSGRQILKDYRKQQPY